MEPAAEQRTRRSSASRLSGKVALLLEPVLLCLCLAAHARVSSGSGPAGPAGASGHAQAAANSSAAWALLAHVCARQDSKRGCLQRSPPPQSGHVDHKEQGGREAPPPLFFFDFPEDGDTIVCETGIDHVCPIDVVLALPAPAVVRAGEVVMLRLQRRVVRSFVVSGSTGGCPILSGAAMEMAGADCVLSLKIRDILRPGRFTLQLDVVGMPLAFDYLALSPKVTFDVVMENACGDENAVLVTLLHFGASLNLSRALGSLNAAARVHIVQAPQVTEEAWSEVVSLEERSLLTSMLAPMNCNKERVVLVPYSELEEHAVLAQRLGAWHGFHVVVEDWIEYPPDYLHVAVANVEFFARSALLAFQGLDYRGREHGRTSPDLARSRDGPLLVPSCPEETWADVVAVGLVAFHSSLEADYMRDGHPPAHSCAPVLFFCLGACTQSLARQHARARAQGGTLFRSQEPPSSEATLWAAGNCDQTANLIAHLDAHLIAHLNAHLTAHLSLRALSDTTTAGLL